MRVYKIPVIIIDEAIEKPARDREQDTCNGSENWRSLRDPRSGARSQVIDRETSWRSSRETWRSRMSTNKTLVSSSKVAIAKNNYYKIIVHCIKALKLNKTFVSMYKTPVRIIEDAIAKSSYRSSRASEAMRKSLPQAGGDRGKHLRQDLCTVNKILIN